MTVARQAGVQGGLEAFKVLKAKYGMITTSSVVSMLRVAFDTKQKGTIVEYANASAPKATDHAAEPGHGARQGSHSPNARAEGRLCVCV